MNLITRVTHQPYVGRDMKRREAGESITRGLLFLAAAGLAFLAVVMAWTQP